MKPWKITAVAFVFLLAGCGQGDQEARAPEAGGDASPPLSAYEGFSEPATTGPCEGIPVELCDVIATANASGDASETPPLVLNTGDTSVRVSIEIADSTNEMARGLMGRTALAQDAGMLFVYPEERELSFWMRNTLIPLSIAYMDSRGRIVDIQDMRPLDDEEPHYTSAEPAQYALEVNRGFFDERGVEVGDRAELPG